MSVSQWNCPPVSGEDGYGQGDGGQVLDHCSKYIHGFGKVGNPQLRGGREAKREGTDLESQDDYRSRYAREQDEKFRRGDEGRGNDRQAHYPGGNSPRVAPASAPKGEPLGDFPWWEQDETQPVSVPIEVENRGWFGKKKK